MKWVKWICISVVLLSTTASCKRVILRDPDVYWNEIRFFEMALKQNTQILREYVESGACSCDEEGNWTEDVCERAATNVVTIESRLGWHVANMEYLGKFNADPPPEQEPEIPSPSTLCPGGE